LDIRVAEVVSLDTTSAMRAGEQQAGFAKEFGWLPIHELSQRMLSA
jgi:hypothetical protein